MVIYGEFLFLENTVTGAVILILTGRLCGIRGSAGRVACGSILCGMYSFMLFAPIHWLAALAAKGAFSAAVVKLSLKPDLGRPLVRATVCFYIVSCLMGGITIALMYAVKAPGMSANGSIYLYGITYLQIITGVLVSVIGILWLSDHLKEKLLRERQLVQVVVEADGRRFAMRGFRDTGNFLTEPVSGSPVAVASPEAGEKLLGVLSRQAVETRLCVVPYRAVGERGILYGVRADRITIETAPGKQITKENIVVAVSNRDFDLWQGTDRYELLLNERLMDGEEEQ